ncbi:hypothetical protein BH23PLA1_BH23PLA1_11180 [soil metagenome]
MDDSKDLDPSIDGSIRDQVLIEAEDPGASDTDGIQGAELLETADARHAGELPEGCICRIGEAKRGLKAAGGQVILAPGASKLATSPTVERPHCHLEPARLRDHLTNLSAGIL